MHPLTRSACIKTLSHRYPRLSTPISALEAARKTKALPGTVEIRTKTTTMLHLLARTQTNHLK